MPVVISHVNLLVGPMYSGKYNMASHGVHSLYLWHLLRIGLFPMSAQLTSTHSIASYRVLCTLRSYIFPLPMHSLLLTFSFWLSMPWSLLRGILDSILLHCTPLQHPFHIRPSLLQVNKSWKVCHWCLLHAGPYGISFCVWKCREIRHTVWFTAIEVLKLITAGTASYKSTRPGLSVYTACDPDPYLRSLLFIA